VLCVVLYVYLPVSALPLPARATGIDIDIDIDTGATPRRAWLWLTVAEMAQGATPRPTGDRGEVRAASQIPERSFRLGLGTEWHSVITALYGRYSINIVNNSQSQSQRLYSLIGTVQYGLGLRACGLCYSSSGKCTVTRIML
jgi:hypothetical protein